MFASSSRVILLCYVCNATDSLTRRKWKKRSPCIAKCVINFIIVQLNERNRTSRMKFFLVILFYFFLFFMSSYYLLLSPPFPIIKHKHLPEPPFPHPWWHNMWTIPCHFHLIKPWFSLHLKNCSLFGNCFLVL